jgi:hypothetical protein
LQGIKIKSDSKPGFDQILKGITVEDWETWKKTGVLPKQREGLTTCRI